ncbi:MAG: ABC transporter permease [Bacteroidota bacterium]|nr:ABC transporter permease [Bacteroidota bacterium]
MSTSLSITFPAKIKIFNKRVSDPQWLQHSLIRIVVPIVLLTGWEIASRLGYIKPVILPSPSAIISTFEEMIRSGELFQHLGISIARVLQGFAIGAFVGIVLGIFIGLFKKIDQALSILLGVLRPIPIMAWIPVLILWMGIDEASKITVIAIGSFWPVLVNVIDGIKNVDRKYLEVARILEKNKFQILTKVVFPAALPNIFTGLRIGIGIAWMCVVAAEMIAATSGIGYLIMYSRELLQSDVMFVGVFSIGLTGVLIDRLLKLVEVKVLKWNVNVNN